MNEFSLICVLLPALAFVAMLLMFLDAINRNSPAPGRADPLQRVVLYCVQRPRCGMPRPVVIALGGGLCLCPIARPDRFTAMGSSTGPRTEEE